MTQDAAAMSAPSAGSATVPFAPYYQDEAVTIYNADCRKVLPFLERFDLLLTDPPYGMARDGKPASTSSHGGHKGYEFAGWDDEPPKRHLFDMMFEASKDQIIWGANFFPQYLNGSMGWLLWDKGQRIDQSDGELAYASRDAAFRVFVLNRAAIGKDGAVHPTQKPLALMRWCLSFFPDAATVLDPFMGSGTTLVAAKLEGRKAVGIEISEKYCEAAANRLRQGVLF